MKGLSHQNARRRAARRGFTLVELIISLVAGLFVAIAVMGVSKEATNTFHEEIRVASAEMGLRIAMERLRLDLGRAAFMGTGNILGDPLIARAAGYVGTTPTLSNFTGGAIPYSFANLSGISLHPQGAVALTSQYGGDGNAAAQLGTLNGLYPDSIDIEGNFSTSDEYPASIVPNPPGAGACSGAVAISLEMATPAGWRIRNAEAAGAASGGAYVAGSALQAAFHPGANKATQFLMKLVDYSGHSQYLLGCAGGVGVATQYSITGPAPTALIYLSPFSKILSNNDTGGVGGVLGYSAGLVTVSPLQVVRWDVMTPKQLNNVVATAQVPATYLYNQTVLNLSNPNVGVDPSDFLLTRSYVDFSGACGTTSPCPIDPDTVEIIAEYAVDLKFGLTVDSFVVPPCSGTAAFPCSMAPLTYTSNPLLNIPMDSSSLTPTSNNQYATQTGPYSGGVGPQRIRDVQARVGIRSPFADRSGSLPVAASHVISNGYLYRYQLDANAAHYNAQTPYARLRESTTEVTLVNQARIFW